MTFSAIAPAKVNLTLEVLGRREDGYHDLRSVVLRIGLCDRLTVEPAGHAPRDRLSLSGLPGAPINDNLVLRAIAALRARIDHDLPALATTLDKQIPIAAGVGGGSSDAAAAIGLAQAAWGVQLAPAEEVALAASVGSDVAFFVCGGAMALVEGRGERVNPLPAIEGELALLLVFPPMQLSTAQVFATYDDFGTISGFDGTLALADALAHGVTGEWLSGQAEQLRDANDLWPLASTLSPQLALLRAELETRTERAFLLSGSGPTLFALYPSLDDAVSAGAGLAVAQNELLRDHTLTVVDLVGPDPAWRYP